MEHVAAILLLVGCSSDLATCQEIPAPTAIYETDEECRVELRVGLAAAAGTAPRTFGTCVYVDPASEEEDAELVWDVRPDGKLYAAVETPDTMIVSSINRAGDPNN